MMANPLIKIFTHKLNFKRTILKYQKKIFLAYLFISGLFYNYLTQ